jgi:hypothetical protein
MIAAETVYAEIIVATFKWTPLRSGFYCRHFKTLRELDHPSPLFC